MQRFCLTQFERAFGKYDPGRYAWHLPCPVPFEEAIPYRGRQGLFDVPTAILPANARRRPSTMDRPMKGKPEYRLLIDDVPTDRRLAWICISDAVLVEILKGFRKGGLRAFTVTDHALPPDARAIGYRFAGDAGTLSLLIHSQSFEPVPDDQVQAPHLPTPTIRVVSAALPKRQDRDPR